MAVTKIEVTQGQLYIIELEAGDVNHRIKVKSESQGLVHCTNELVRRVEKHV